MNLEASIVSELLAEGDVGQGEIKRAESLKEPNVDILVMLERLGLVSEQRKAVVTANVMRLPLADAGGAPDSPPELCTPVSIRFLRQFQLIPVRQNAEILEVWSAQAHLDAPLNALKVATSKELDIRVATRSIVTALLDKWHPDEVPEQFESRTDFEYGTFDDVEQLRDMASEAPVIRLVNQILQDAVEMGASDIHLEPFEMHLKLRFRVDGVLEESPSPPFNLTAAILSRFKILAKLDIAERRLPQDGRLHMRVQGREVDLRVSTVPTAYGESLVLRLLDREAVQLDLAGMGFTEHMCEQLEEVLRKPHGIFLVTGPTGSGKTSTLYAALARLNSQHVKIITVEDPIEYRLEGVNQIQVKPKIGLDFANALRSIVRQDPDIILVGEMRDTETARTAIQSALTGHLVLSTLHTNSAASGLTRLRDMGVENYLVTSTVNALMAQRLVRKLEPKHAAPYVATRSEIERFKLRRFKPSGDITLYRPVPSELSATGFRGRIPIAELVRMSDALGKAVIENASASTLEQIAREEGSQSMAEDGIQKALDGLTTLEEVMRVTQMGRA